MEKSINYTAPELCTYNMDTSRPWFVYFDVTDLGTDITIRKQFRGGINYYTDPKQRLKMGGGPKKVLG